MKLVLASDNKNKLREFRTLFENFGVELISKAESGFTEEVEETGETFAENARIKAEAFCKASGLPTVADDSGLCTDALNGAPGVYSARYAGHHGDDDANNEKLLREMADVPEGQRGARFVSAVCFMLPDGRALEVEGECPGRIAFSLQNGDYGFGYDPLFIPDAYGTPDGCHPNTEGRSYAQLTPAEKDEYGDEKGARKALVEKYGEMAEHPIVKMSKSLGNVVNPDDVVNEYGADTLRLYEMFIGDFEKAAPWNTSSIKGCKRFLDKIWSMSEKLVPGEGVRPELEAVANRTIKKVGEDIDALKANTAIAQLMIYVNALSDQGGATKAEYELLLQLLNPFAPHMTEELWQQLGHTEQLAYYPWPAYDEAKCVEQTIEIAVQVNGKVKARIKVPAAIENADAIAAAKAEPAVAEAIVGKTIAKEIYVKGKLVNIAVKG